MILSSAYAEQNDLLRLLNVLNDNGTITTAQYEALKNGVESKEPDDDDDGGEDDGNQVEVSTKGGIEISTYDGQFSVAIGGRLMVDGAFYNEDNHDLGDGTENRRARIDLEGIVAGDLAYEFGIDFADGEADVKDAYLGYEAFRSMKILVGQFKEPFSLEEMTSLHWG